jgi:putative spermidine/putrescine transport system permease protein
MSLRREQRLPLLMVAPLAALMVAIFVLPLLASLESSLHAATPKGIDRSQWTLASYGKMFDAFYGGIFLRTLRISIVISGVTAVLAYPVALFVTSMPPRQQALMLLIYMSPWLVNVVVKAFGWSLLLGPKGAINAALLGIGLIGEPLKLMFNETGVVIGLVHGHFIFVLLPLWAALAGLDPNLRWAAGNLGARPWQTFLRITLPLSLPALMAGTIINFTMNMAAFATPALLGGSRVRMAAYVAYEVNLVELDWPLGAAMAVELLVVTLALVVFSQYVAASGKRRILFEAAR